MCWAPSESPDTTIPIMCWAPSESPDTTIPATAAVRFPLSHHVSHLNALSSQAAGVSEQEE
jgi:hypothetical protein